MPAVKKYCRYFLAAVTFSIQYPINAGTQPVMLCSAFRTDIYRQAKLGLAIWAMAYYRVNRAINFI